MSYDDVIVRLEDFSIVDEHSRWNCTLQSAILALAYALVTDLALGRRRAEIVIGIVLIVGIYHIAYIFWYCTRSSAAKPVDLNANASFSRIRFVRYAALTVMTGFVLAGRRIQAEVIRYKLAALTLEPITPKKLQSIEKLSRNAMALSVPDRSIQRRAIKDAGTRISEAAQKDNRIALASAKALDSLMSYGSSLDSISALPHDLVGELDNQKDAVRIAPMFTYKGSAPVVFGVGKTVPRKDKAELMASQDAAKYDFPGPQGMFVIGTADAGSVPTEINIDRHVLRRVGIVNCHIVYSGGPLFIDRVCFAGCTFRTEPNSPLYYAFVQAVLGADCVDLLVSPGGGNFFEFHEPTVP
jgi:hypothetical protein